MVRWDLTSCGWPTASVGLTAASRQFEFDARVRVTKGNTDRTIKDNSDYLCDMLGGCLLLSIWQAGLPVRP